MTLTTTLKALRENKACISGYNKLVCALQGIEYEEQDTYIRFHYDEPIAIQFILNSNGLCDALWALRACEQSDELIRAMRLFAVWCARQIQHLMKDERSVRALDVAERYANGEVGEKELRAARKAAADAVDDTAYAAYATTTAAYAAAYAADYAPAHAAYDATYAYAAFDAARSATLARSAMRELQKQKFVEVFCGETINVNALK